MLQFLMYVLLYLMVVTLVLGWMGFVRSCRRAGDKSFRSSRRCSVSNVEVHNA